MIQPKTSVFSLPLQSWQQTASARERKFEVQDEHKVGRKRRRSEVVDLTQDSDDLGTTDFESGLESSQNLTQYPVLTPDEAHQYRVAGLSLDQELPGGEFPHAAIKNKDRKRKGPQRLARKLQEQWPPIYLPGSQTTETTFHVQHLGVLTAILHRSLLEGNFTRAGRVWGMLLHERFGKDPVDIRHGGRWGIGAEILLRQNAASPNTSKGHIFTRPGFEAAKAYYERLIIQYPSRSARSSASSSLQFYPAMFSLWIYVVDHESKISREALEQEEEDLVSERSADFDANLLNNDDTNNAHRNESTMSRVASIRRIELAGAEEIAARMDEIMVGPPYSDSPALLRLRGMVALWIGDLQFSSLGHQEEEEEEEDTNMSGDEGLMTRRASASRLLASRELHVALERRAVENAKANDLFEKAKARQLGAKQINEETGI